MITIIPNSNVSAFHVRDNLTVFTGQFAAVSECLMLITVFCQLLVFKIFSQCIECVSTTAF